LLCYEVWASSSQSFDEFTPFSVSGTTAWSLLGAGGYEFFKVRAIEAPSDDTQAVRSAWSNVVAQLQTSTSIAGIAGTSGSSTRERGSASASSEEQPSWLLEEIFGGIVLLGLLFVIATLIGVYCVSSRGGGTTGESETKFRGVELGKSGGWLAGGMNAGRSRSPPERGLLPDGVVGFDPKSFNLRGSYFGPSESFGSRSGSQHHFGGGHSSGPVNYQPLPLSVPPASAAPHSGVPASWA
jgi:hypothetical protein